MRFDLLDPTAKPTTPEVRLAARPSDLRGLRVGLIENTKANAAGLLEAVAEVLKDDLKPAEVIRRKVPATLPASEEVLDELARDCDLVIEAVGD
ncbi:MAG: hypothetical protein J2O39_06725 [Acidimicrobiales bacterium]|nr:hypothetical protein [Acidimicrobiales bacterium]MBO0887159.1 hypothetical protein [Acidimicrobiales bacterium]MBO0894053.1 hypothetical protein [Acidimicrobiales bacterium]